MKLDVALITTNISSRLHLLRQTIASIDACEQSAIYKKTISIDLFPQETSLEDMMQIIPKEWKVVSGVATGRRGMLLNQMRVTATCESPYTLYCEDDIIIEKIPSAADLQRISSANIGFMCYNTHISDKEKIPDSLKTDLSDIRNLLELDNGIVFLKTKTFKDQYYLNFPVSLVKTEIFSSMHKHIHDHLHGLGIEPATTKAWFDLKYDQSHHVGLYLKSKIKPILGAGKADIATIHNHAQMRFWNNDVSLRHPSINNRENSIV